MPLLSHSSGDTVTCIAIWLCVEWSWHDMLESPELYKLFEFYWTESRSTVYEWCCGYHAYWTLFIFRMVLAWVVKFKSSWLPVKFATYIYSAGRLFVWFFKTIWRNQPPTTKPGPPSSKLCDNPGLSGSGIFQAYPDITRVVVYHKVVGLFPLCSRNLSAATLLHCHSLKGGLIMGFESSFSLIYWPHVAVSHQFFMMSLYIPDHQTEKSTFPAFKQRKDFSWVSS